MTTDNQTTLDRRAYLAAVAGSAALAGCFLFERGEDAATVELADDRARALAERFAPTLYFDEHERWFPTDPRPYITEEEGKTVVDGFDALDSYTDRSKRSDEPPAPMLFYHAIRYVDSSLAVVQYWYYSVFDQFTTNFHWHDWEVLHVFVDVDSGDPQLYVASSHSGGVPNNEFIDPEPSGTPRVLSELGSHSSALSLNDVAERFQRITVGDTIADITNSAVEGITDLAGVPVAYGLPRDEGFRLPFIVPELDDVPIYDHDRLPSVNRDDLIADELTIRSFTDLLSPPVDLPERSTGRIFEFANGDDLVDIGYDLVPTAELEDIVDFTGPQLGFEFTIPEFGENAIAKHITTSSVPWHQPRYTNPAEDISDPTHRGTLAERYDAVGEPSLAGTVVASVTQAVADDDAPDDEGVTTEPSIVEGIAVLESDPEVVPTFAGGTMVLQDVPEDDHRLTINAAGVAPHSEEVSVRGDDGLTPAGVDGEVPLVANEHAVKLEVDPREADGDFSGLAVEDDFAGRLYDAPLTEPDAVYVHRGGAYTVEVRDVNDELGAIRVNPEAEATVRIDDPRTGKASLARFLATIAEETAATIASVATDGETEDSGDRENAARELEHLLAAVAESARQAVEHAEAGDRSNADAALDAVTNRLDRVAERLDEARETLPDEIGRATERRLEQSQRRSAQAKAAGKL